MNAAQLIAKQKTAHRSHFYLGHHGAYEPPGQIVLDDLFVEPMKQVVTKPKDEHFVLVELGQKFPDLRALIFTLFARHVFNISMQRIVQEQLAIGTVANRVLLCTRDLIRAINDVWCLYIHRHSEDNIRLAQELVADVIGQAEASK